MLAGFLYWASPGRTRAENRADYRYEDYAEENGRIHVQTQGAYFDTELKPWVSLQGNFIYDVISGATPTGAPPLPGSDQVATAPMDDKRYAGFLEPVFKFANHTLSPQVAYSEESDYRSIGVALNDALDFNDKNTTVTVGISHSFDHVLPNEGELYYATDLPLTHDLRKDDSAVLLGVVQLLGPTTLLTVDGTLGYADGYLSDPYKRVLFDNFPFTPGQPAYTVFPEHRPGHKFRQSAFVSLQQYVDAAQGAVEASYRLYHDDYEITAHTVSVQWNQKLGKHIILSPLFRFYTQTAAHFYATHFPGDPTDPTLPIPLPDFYSSDYRLSALDSYTYGVRLSARVHERLTLDLSLLRYEMYGTDGITSPSQYPKATTVSGGLTLWF